MLRILALAALVLAVLAAGPSRAAELVMFEAPGCAWCTKWHRDLGAIYPKTDEGKLLPLRVVGLRDARPRDLRKIKDLKYAPTFVAVECGREIGRITGYGGDEAFWGELSVIVEKMKKEGRPRTSC